MLFKEIIAIYSEKMVDKHEWNMQMSITNQE
jgi:uncharacterized protein YqgQ